MQYGKILPARFLSRPNRFVARVEAEGEELVCHVKIPGAAGNCWYPEPPSGWRRAQIRPARPNLTSLRWKRGPAHQYGRSGPKQGVWGVGSGRGLPGGADVAASGDYIWEFPV